MASWQARVFNSVLAHVARAGINARGARLPLTGIRRRLDALDRRLQSWPADLRARELPLSHSQLLHYRLIAQGEGASQPKCSIFYVRGGGFCFKTPLFHANFIADLCRRLAADTYTPDYRLAPEHPFPAPFNDVLEGYRAFITQVTGPFALMGDSAGGNLAMALLLQARDRGLTLPGVTVLISPALDLAMTGDCERLLATDDPFFSVESLLRLRGAYLQGANPTDERVSPLLGNLHALPPVMVLAGGREMLLEDTERLITGLQLAGNEVESHILPDMPHVFPLFSLLPEAALARQLIRDCLSRRLF